MLTIDPLDVFIIDYGTISTFDKRDDLRILQSTKETIDEFYDLFEYEN
jgi:hypothetical protein